MLVIQAHSLALEAIIFGCRQTLWVRFRSLMSWSRSSRPSVTGILNWIKNSSWLRLRSNILKVGIKLVSEKFESWLLCWSSGTRTIQLVLVLQYAYTTPRLSSPSWCIVGECSCTSFLRLNFIRTDKILRKVCIMRLLDHSILYYIRFVA